MGTIAILLITKENNSVETVGGVMVLVPSYQLMMPYICTIWVGVEDGRRGRSAGDIIFVSTQAYSFSCCKL